ncbi:MAG: porin, partial [Gammaproteobacteria bacterium]|nr:porin [Gammaproteobacteria bacterium]
NTSYGGSIAYLFSFGLNLQAAYAENESNQTGATKGKTWYAKVGYKFGNNAVSVGYGESQDVIVGFKDKGFNIGFNHNLPKAKVDLYAGISGNTLDTPTGFVGTGGGTSVDDIYTFTVGTKLKFD